MTKTTNKLRLAREAKGLTRIEAAKIIDVSPMSFYFWERGEKTPNKKNMLKIKKAFDVEPIDMLGI